jgi:hypothetical protein
VKEILATAAVPPGLSGGGDMSWNIGGGDMSRTALSINDMVASALKVKKEQGGESQKQ